MFACIPDKIKTTSLYIEANLDFKQKTTLINDR